MTCWAVCGFDGLGSLTTVLCHDLDVLAHAISLIDWLKHVTSFFFSTPGKSPNRQHELDSVMCKMQSAMGEVLIVQSKKHTYKITNRKGLLHVQSRFTMGRSTDVLPCHF